MQAVKALVIIMGVIIVVGFVVVVATILMRLSEFRQDSSTLAQVHLDLAESCTIGQIAAMDRRLALRIDGPAADGCDRVVLVDPGNGAVTGTVRPGAAPVQPGDEGTQP